MTACSCNGFHSDELKAELKTDEYFLWKIMTEKHRKEQYNLILQGGDQVKEGEGEKGKEER